MSAENSSSKKIRVMLVDDHMIVRMGMSFAVNNQPDMQVIAQAQDGIEAIELYRSHQPDVVVLDLRMPKRNGIETISFLRREFTGARILVLSNYDAGDEIASAIQAGAQGFVPKDTSLNSLMEAIRRVNDGEEFIPPEIGRRLTGRLASQLSNREIEVLSMMGKGLSNKEVGAALNVTESTIKIHVAHIFSKLEVGDRTQAVLKAIKRGIIHMD
ncbi:MAG: response regulator transcription factor [Nibricoccus sp.]